MSPMRIEWEQYKNNKWSNLLEHEAAKAPRVLNANFSTTKELDGVLDVKTALVAGCEYHLLVDVGPRWLEFLSAVLGNAEFPEFALRSDEEGHDVEVVLSSDDFEPKLQSGRIRLPRGTGRSTPYTGDQLSPRPGPLVLTLRAPDLLGSAADWPITARARLCLYYENNLLQSAVVRAGVARASGTVLDEPNTVNIDYVLTQGFGNVAQFASRTVRFGPDDNVSEHPVALNLTLNGDGSGRHRILVKHRKGLPPGYISYDPANTADVLKQARSALGGCFFLRDEGTGNFVAGRDGKPQVALNQDNSKSINQFKWDLLKLAEVGSALYNQIFLQVKPADARQTNAEWVFELSKVLADTSIIQVARTTPANYVFPWGLVYEHPLDNPSAYQFCKVINEDWTPGTAPGTDPSTRTRCKYHDEFWHQDNILCPYGFWGLKHVIEQPPSELTDLTAMDFTDNPDRSVRVKSPVNIGVAVSLDNNFDQGRMKAHLEWLKGHLTLNLPPAADWDRVCSMLQAPGLFYYFLCHDEWDEHKRDCYLGVGPRDDDESHKIYAQRLVAWLRKQNPKAWKERHPLIFINGCHTADLRPGQVLNFVPAFTAAGACGVIGTEVSVVFQVAVEAGEALLDKLVGGSLCRRSHARRAVGSGAQGRSAWPGLHHVLPGRSEIRGRDRSDSAQYPCGLIGTRPPLT